MSSSGSPVRLCNEGPVNAGRPRQAGAANADSHRYFDDVASMGTNGWPLSHAGNPIARGCWHCCFCSIVGLSSPNVEFGYSRTTIQTRWSRSGHLAEEIAADFTLLSFFRRYRPDQGREACMGRGIDRPVLDLRAGRILAQEVIAVPIPRRSDWSGNKTTAAIRTDVS